jgi:L-Ala-D/L-Glu epimerase / N-acetyl-D-glutamate racemase
MRRALRVTRESWPLARPFRIARGIKTEADVVVVSIEGGGHVGHGECVPYGRYGESVAGVTALIASAREAIESGLERDLLQRLLPAGAARNALDCALIDWEAKRRGVPAHALLGLPPPRPVRTLFTLSLDTPAAMADAAREAVTCGRRLLKLKVAGGDDLARVEAVRAAAPEATVIADANEGWRAGDLHRLTPALAHLGVALIEQPLPAADDAALEGLASPVPLCADESCHTRADLPRVVGRYSHINVKLDKAGGLTEALALAQAARAQGLRLMVGCMVSTSLAMAPVQLLAGMAEFVDLDGPLLLARDRRPAIAYAGDMMALAPAELWG